MDNLTYNEGRRCLKPDCNKPIADQENGNRKYCRPEEDSNGNVIKDCKEEHNIRIKKMRMAPFKKMMNHHILMYEAINQLYAEKGEFVNLEDINRLGINLFRPFEFGSQNGNSSYLYHHYCGGKKVCCN